ncbi:site-2 protease family protein, partial [uncultured Desulfovibrio sp.]|uniref:site-2 protease family protein n=1 Tax=uncultured Desulfovibrio sp. TaxID=167968 RepID=UPI002624877F
MLTTILAVIIVLGGLIFFHELGHFAVARALGMGVSTFSLGFGPKILTRKVGKTEYALSLVPLGGYVALVGESDEADIPEGFTPAESFARRPAWQRLLVVAAGPAANILLAWLLCWALAFGWGVPVLQPVVGAVTAESPAARAGLLPGDRILSIDGGSM